MSAPDRNPAQSLGDVLLGVLIEIALNQTDPAERDAMLAILKNDGWLDA